MGDPNRHSGGGEDGKSGPCGEHAVNPGDAGGERLYSIVVPKGSTGFLENGETNPEENPDGQPADARRGESSENQEQIVVAVEDLCRFCRHEINNKKTGAIGYLTLARIKLDDLVRYKGLDTSDSQVTAIREFLNMAEESQNQISDVVANIRERAASVEMSKIPLSDVMEAIVNRLQRLYEPGSSVTVEIGKDIEAGVFINANLTKLTQILDNIFKNAIEAMADVKERPKKLKVRLFSENGDAVIMISDNGSGVHPAVLQNLGKEGNTTKGRGHGLGLNFLMGYLAKMGGKFHLSNNGDASGLMENGHPVGAMATIKFPLSGNADRA